MDAGLHDDFFGEDDFDDLPADTLDELEEKARILTQHKQTLVPTSTHHRQHQQQVPNGISRGHGVPANHSSSDYGFDNEEDVIDLDAQPSFAQNNRQKAQTNRVDEVTQREQWRQERYAQPSQLWHRQEGHDSHSLRPSQAVNGGHPAARQHQDDSMLLDVKPDEGNTIDISALQLRIAELEHQAQDLAKTADDARAASMSKAGEIAIVRANQQKEIKEFERKMKTLQQMHSEEVAKSKAELEGMRKERERFETNNRFLEHDLARESERVRNARRTLRDGNGNTTRRAQPSPLSTPRKNKNLPLRDGFDDGEVVMVSPSKTKDRTQAPTTPKVGVKRKRSQHDDVPTIASPAMSFSEAEYGAQDGTPSAPLDHSELFQNIEPDDKFELTQLILDHRTEDGQCRTLESLMKLSFPSRPEHNLASMIYDKMTQAVFKQDTDDFRVQICSVVVDQWTQCLTENFYDPLHDLTDLLQFILMISPTMLSTSLISRLTPLCQQTIDLVTLPTIKACKDPVANTLPTKAFKQRVDPTDVLDILQLLANHAMPTSVKSSTSPSDLINLWSHMGFESTLFVLHKAQPLHQIKLMLNLLHTSILPSSFGPIFPDSSRQKKMESDLIERLGNLLLEIPVQPKPPPRPTHFTDFLRKKTVEEEDEEAERSILPYEVHEILALRSAVLDLLYALALSEYGGTLVATHKNAIARLVRFLHESVVKMYMAYDGHDAEILVPETGDTVASAEPDTAMDPQPLVKKPSAHALHTAHINCSVTLLYHLSTTYGTVSSSPSTERDETVPLLNLLTYFASHPSASQRFLVALSRIAFSDPWGVEGGIEEDVAGMAHELLDETVSPEEGEGVLSVFGSGKVSGAAGLE